MDSDGSYSELTELESDDYKEKHKKKTTGSIPKNGGYRIKNALKVPRATTYTAQALYDQIHSCDINLEPDYQRDVVWPETKQIGIIDSVFRNFYIPPVIFAVNSFEDGSETKTCIDGKQRLTSIHSKNGRFMDGLIPHKDPLTSEKLWYKDVQSTSGRTRPRKLLPEKYRRLFANKQIVCVEYQDITDSDEREIFQRVQLGMALTPAEKLQVINTPRAVFIRELQAAYLKEENGLAGDALEWDRGRGSDFRCLAQSVFCIQKFGPSMKSAGSILQLEKWLSETEEFDSTFKARVQDGFRVFLDLVLDKKLNKVFKKHAKISPIEFILISLLVTVHKDNFSKAELSTAIGTMRDDVRDTHVDIRMNDRVARTMLQFIRQMKPSKVAGDTGNIAGSGAGEKRKRTGEEDNKINPKKTQPAITSSEPPPKPQATLPPPGPKNPAQTSSFASSSSSDRMAAIRAAKTMAAQVSHRPPLSSSSTHTLQSNHAAPQLPSPGQSFSFNGNTYQGAPQPAVPPHSLPQQPSQRLPHRPSSYNILEASTMSQMPQPNDHRSRLETSAPPPYDHNPNRTYDQDRYRNIDSRRPSYPRTGDTGWGSRQG
ncbi:hypothetical protein BDZ94DRAFT_127231 [Collybia nuda]|uniref:GmrSD restriction endonucleases N-terminal domain-containing protein n=1 Tax=Collybia nuda TaxID=64659 RepID=A0A9P5YCD7_9AGAR|nr:hypothetical protein BDZ94DRAFT_127231 [Collybia nuda]